MFFNICVPCAVRRHSFSSIFHLFCKEHDSSYLNYRTKRCCCLNFKNLATQTTDNDWKHSKSIFIMMSDPTDASSNGEYSTCLGEEESESFSRQKRQCRSSSLIAAQPVAAVSTTTASSNEKTIYDVPDAVLALSFAFVGKGTFRYTASVCKTFHKVYKSAFHDTTDTSMESAVATIACAKMYLEEDSGGMEITRYIGTDNKHHWIWNGMFLEEDDGGMEITHYILTTDEKPHYIWNGAARHGRLEILEWIYKSNYSNCFDINTAGVAAEHGHLSALKWLHVHGCPVDESTCESAAYGGCLSLLQWCRANGCPWNRRTCERAAENGHLSLLQWCHANGCPWDASTCSMAAENGHLSIIQWCRANGCPWDASTCRSAAGSGHLSLLQWCRANGCPWNRNYCAVVACGNTSVVQWCRAN